MVFIQVNVIVMEEAEYGAIKHTIQHYDINSVTPKGW